MFVTLPDFEFPVPPQLKAAPDARHWRGMSLQHFGAWHVLTVRTQHVEDAEVVSFIFRWDLDVADLLENPDVTEVLSLFTMVHDDGRKWTAVPILEVWRGRDETGVPCVVFVDHEGRTRSGFLGDMSERLKRETLVARIGDPAKATGQLRRHRARRTSTGRRP